MKQIPEDFIPTLQQIGCTPQELTQCERLSRIISYRIQRALSNDSHRALHATLEQIREWLANRINSKQAEEEKSIQQYFKTADNDILALEEVIDYCKSQTPGVNITGMVSAAFKKLFDRSHDEAANLIRDQLGDYIYYNNRQIRDWFQKWIRRESYVRALRVILEFGSHLPWEKQLINVCTENLPEKPSPVIDMMHYLMKQKQYDFCDVLYRSYWHRYIKNDILMGKAALKIAEELSPSFDRWDHMLEIMKAFNDVPQVRKEIMAHIIKHLDELSVEQLESRAPEITEEAEIILRAIFGNSIKTDPFFKVAKKLIEALRNNGVSFEDIIEREFTTLLSSATFDIAMAKKLKEAFENIIGMYSCNLFDDIINSTLDDAEKSEDYRRAESIREAFVPKDYQ